MFDRALDLDLIHPYQPILAAVSGGADSMALAAALHEHGALMIVASFDHQIRSDSAEDIAFVSAFCKAHGIPFVSGTGDVLGYAEREKLSLEESARHLRYSFLYNTAAKIGCKAIAVGHTMDDQAETVLMHFIRGAGLAGLKGMLPITFLARFSYDIPLLRPILSWRRSDTEAFCRDRGIEPRFDSTNQDPSYPRNKIRAELLPILTEYNPAITQTLARNAAILAGQYELYADLIDEAYIKTSLRSGENWISFSVTGLSTQPIVLRNEIIRKAVFTLSPGTRDVDAETFDRFTLDQDTNLGAGFQSILDGDELFITPAPLDIPLTKWPQCPDQMRLEEGITALNDGWEIEFSTFEPPFEAKKEKESSEIWIDISDRPTDVALRRYQNGDRFAPFGFANGSVKCSDLFINNKVPARYRKAYPILSIDKDILWVPLLRRGNTRPIQKNTRLAARIRIKQKM